MEDFDAGDQIVYVPSHARLAYRKDGLNALDVECGFVTSITQNTVFCSFWSRTYTGMIRTISCSEGCDRSDLIKRKYTEDWIILAVWKALMIRRMGGS